MKPHTNRHLYAAFPDVSAHDEIKALLDKVETIQTEYVMLDGVTAGTAAAGKVLSLDGTGVVDAFTVTTLTFAEEPLTSSGNGTANGSGVVATERGNGVIHRTVLTLTNTPVAMNDEAGIVAYGGLKVYDCPKGAILILGAVADLELTLSSTGINSNWNGDFAIGTATAGNDATLAATEQDILPTTATPQAASNYTTATGQSTATENKVHDGTTTPIDVFLNFLVDDSDHDVNSTPCNIICNGTITLIWTNMGDY